MFVAFWGQTTCAGAGTAAGGGADSQCKGCFGFAILSHPKRLRWAQPSPPSGARGAPAERQSRSPGEAPACRGSGGGLPCPPHVSQAGSTKRPGLRAPRPALRILVRFSGCQSSGVTSMSVLLSGRRPLSCLIMRRAGQRDRRMLFLAPRRAAEGCLCHRAHLAGMSRVSICIKQSPDPQMRLSQSVANGGEGLRLSR